MRTVVFWLSLVLLLGCQSAVPAVEETVPPAVTASALSGKLVCIQFLPGEQAIAQFDFASQTLVTLFAVPEQGWLSHMDVSPDGAQIVMAYAPPPINNRPQTFLTGLYLALREETAVPRPLLLPENDQEAFFNPVWSPDGRFIYYSHIRPLDLLAAEFETTLERLEVATGEREVLLQDGIWPRLSPNGRLLAFVRIDAVTLERELVVAEANGQNPRTLATTAQFTDIDAPFFAPDGQSLLFGAVDEPQQPVSLLERLLGVQPAAAHAVPSDWWRVPLAGGDPERLTQLNEINMYAAMGENEAWVAFSGGTGLYVMKTADWTVEKLVELEAASSLSWVQE